MPMEFTETSRIACLAARFPQLRTFWTRLQFTEEFSDEYMAAFAKEHRIKELLDTIEKVEAGELSADALTPFKGDRN